MIKDCYESKEKFYDNSIFSGAKIPVNMHTVVCLFYDNSIFSGAKIQIQTFN